MADFERKEEITTYYYDDYLSNYFYENIESHTDYLEIPIQQYRISKVLEIYTPNERERVVDLGCALGTFCFALAPLCSEIIGIDFSSKAVDLCNKLLEKSQYDNIKFVCADVQNTGLESEAYDVVVCADLLEHLYPEVSERVLDECRRILRKGGKLMIWTPHRGHIFEILKNHNIILKKDISHVDYKSMQHLLDGLHGRCFSIRKAYYTESNIPIFRSIERVLLRILPIMRRRIAILAEKI